MINRAVKYTNTFNLGQLAKCSNLTTTLLTEPFKWKDTPTGTEITPIKN